MKLRKHLRFLSDEAAKWPGVILRPLRQSHHAVIEIEFAGQTRKLTCPVSASDYRSDKNTVAILRRILRDLGANKAQ